MQPFFTIIIPTYNSKKITRGLQSIESQTIRDSIEVIFVDDNSTDKSYIKEIENYNFNYKIIYNEKSLGPGGARQVGLNEAQGIWVTFLDHDDEFTGPQCFEQIKNFLEQSHCKFLLDTNIIVAEDYDYFITENYRIIMTPNWVHGKFFNREKIKEYGMYFHPELQSCEDTFFCGLATSIGINEAQINDDETYYMQFEMTTYVWYLWQDSTSHKSYDEMHYFEYHFNDYLRAIFEGLEIVNQKYQNSQMYQIRFCSFISSIHLFNEKFLHEHRYDKQENQIEKYAMPYLSRILKEKNIDKKYIIDFIYENPLIYTQLYIDYVYEYPFCIKETLEQFMDRVYAYNN